jgi:hypothetical protein
MCGEPTKLGWIFDCGYEYSASGISTESQLCMIGEMLLIISLGILSILGIYYLIKRYKSKHP